MPKFIATKNNRIYIVSDNIFSSEGFNIIELPKDFDDVPKEELISDYKVKDNIIYKNINRPIKELKIAFITNLFMQCGISTYAENLFPHIAKEAKDFKFFVEDNNIKDLNRFGENKIVQCWKRGESLKKLIDEIKSYEPDIILINHEFGIFPCARYWLSLMTQLSCYRIITIMHSVFPEHHDKTVYEACIPEIVVHLQAAKDNLKNDKKINAKVHVISHGCYPIIDQNKLWNNYKSNYTFIQQGFGFKYKNFEDSIKATAILKDKYSDVFFTALISESPFNKISHTIYYNELLDLINKLNIEENVGIIRGYQDDNIIDCYLRSNQVAIFPYASSPGHLCLGVSGAARQAMAAGLPVITSNIPHFNDLPVIKTSGAEQIAEELDKLFSNDFLMQEQIKTQNEYIIENSWEEIAKKYIRVIENEK